MASGTMHMFYEIIKIRSMKFIVLFINVLLGRGGGEECAKAEDPLFNHYFLFCKHCTFLDDWSHDPLYNKKYLQ